MRKKIFVFSIRFFFSLLPQQILKILLKTISFFRYAAFWKIAFKDLEEKISLKKTFQIFFTGLISGEFVGSCV
jgi:hypothetical protein